MMDLISSILLLLFVGLIAYIIIFITHNTFLIFLLIGNIIAVSNLL